MKIYVLSIVAVIASWPLATIGQVATLTNNIPVGIDLKPTNLGFKVTQVDDSRGEKNYRCEAKLRILPELHQLSIPDHQAIELKLLDEEGKGMQVLFPSYTFSSSIEKKAGRFCIPRDKNCFVSIDYLFTTKGIKSGIYTIAFSRMKMRVSGSDRDFVPPPHRKSEFSSMPFAIP